MEIKQAIAQVLKEFNKPAYDINNGECEDFAMRVIKLMESWRDGLTDNATPINSPMPGHYWIECDGRCYDAECPEGVEAWWKLPIFQKYIHRKRKASG